MERLSLATAASVAEVLEDGTAVRARKIEKRRPIPSDVSIHEARHSVVAERILWVTNIPNGNALGTTYPVEMTAAAAAAPAAFGHSGCGHDMFIVEHYLRVDPGVAKSAARAKLSGKEEVVYEFGVIIEEKGIAYQNDLDQAWENVDKKRRGIYPVEIEITGPDGKTSTLTAKTFQHEVRIADLLKAA